MGGRRFSTLKPDVTIACITYNRPQYLKVQLKSILAAAANVPDKVRIVVVDDASDTLAAQHICAELGVDYVRHSENRGLAPTLVSAFEQVDSPYYALWGDDDYFLPNWFTLHLAKIREGYDVVAGSYWMANHNLKRLYPLVLPVATRELLLQGKVTCNDGSLVRYDSVGDIRWQPERERAMVMTFWLAMTSGGRKFAAVEEPTWLYRRHEGQLSEFPPDAHERKLRNAAIRQYRSPSTDLR